jgi:hypothetical protein
MPWPFGLRWRLRPSGSFDAIDDQAIERPFQRPLADLGPTRRKTSLLDIARS